ncbi:hypothetical protein SDC49_05010 [Lactobacillus sp. R2/2]|nr:hypothetical protein [Lactobacillus sp. R2/2]
MRVAIVEDNKFELNKLLGCFRQYEQDHNIQIDIITFNNGLEFINHYCNNFDVIYFDVQMPEMDGMTAAKKSEKLILT